MVDPSKVDLSKIDQEARLRIFEYVRRKKRVKPKDVGVTPSYFNKIRRKERPVSDKLLAKLLRFLTIEELRDLVGPIASAKDFIISKNGKLDYITIAEIFKIVEREAERDPFLRSLIIDVARRWIEKAQDIIHSYTIKPEHINEFKKLISDRGFGFISDTDGREVFFHKSGLIDVQFEALREEQTVEFEVEKSPKGPRAFNIRTVQ